MNAFNELFRRSVDNLAAQENLAEDKARGLVRNFFNRRRGGGGKNGKDRPKVDAGRPSEFSSNGKAPSILLRPDICDEMLDEEVVCDDNAEFREIDGRCNNLKHPLWGSAGIAMRRLLKPDYGDDIRLPRGVSATSRKRSAAKKGSSGGSKAKGPRPTGGGGKGGRPNGGGPRPRPPPPKKQRCRPSNPLNLPNARFVSTEFHPDQDLPDPTITHMLVQMGQFLDHDITLTPETHVDSPCCEVDHENCMTIEIPNSDSFFSQHSQTCLEFTRSTPFCEDQESDKRPREQINGITAFVDASNVYGSDDETAAKLRSNAGDGKLLYEEQGDGFYMLPDIDGVREAGDVRATEMPGLASMHTLFLREHNRVAAAIQAANPGLDGESIYQRARKVVIAEMQNIVYSEYLPAVLGDDAIRKYKLSIPSGTDNTKYEDKMDPSITNAFATAAYRFGHSMIQGLINILDEVSGAHIDSFALRDNYFDLTHYFGTNGEGMERLIKGLITQAAQTNDRFLTEDVTNFLFPGGANFGSDLVARNIQRGRDHGLPGYNEWRRFCDMDEVCSFDDDAPPQITQDNWDRLAALYESPSDIDLFTAGLAEIPVNGGLTGPTFNCIKAIQFKMLLHGDRFFFSHRGQFGDDQLTQLKARTLADVICDNTNIENTPTNAFVNTSADRSCDNKNVLNLSLF